MTNQSGIKVLLQELPFLNSLMKASNFAEKSLSKGFDRSLKI